MNSIYFYTVLLRYYGVSNFHRILRQISPPKFFSCFLHQVHARKWHVYRRKVRDLADLRQRIIEAVEFLTPHLLINTWQELEYRLDNCRATKGTHIEVYGSA